MRVLVKTPPAGEPLERDAVKTELRIDGSELDEYVDRLIVSARTYFENETGWALICRTLTASLRWWPKSTNILLPYPPLFGSVPPIVTYYPLGVATVWPAAEYQLDYSARQGSVLVIPGSDWPQIDEPLYPPGVVVEYVAGFGEADDNLVPGDVLEALMGLISFWDEVPEAVYVPGTNKTAGKVDVMPLHAQSVIERYRKARER